MSSSCAQRRRGGRGGGASAFAFTSSVREIQCQPCASCDAWATVAADGAAASPSPSGPAFFASASVVQPRPSPHTSAVCSAGGIGTAPWPSSFAPQPSWYILILILVLVVLFASVSHLRLHSTSHHLCRCTDAQERLADRTFPRPHVFAAGQAHTQASASP